MRKAWMIMVLGASALTPLAAAQAQEVSADGALQIEREERRQERREQRMERREARQEQREARGEQTGTGEARIPRAAMVPQQSGDTDVGQFRTREERREAWERGDGRPAWREQRQEARQERRQERLESRQDALQDRGRDRAEWRQDRRDDRQDWRRERREDRQEWRQDRRGDRRDWRDDRRDDRRDWRWDRREDRRDWRHNWRNDWNWDWRRDNRYDWQRWRNNNRSLFRLPRYYAPRGYNYTRFGIGVILGRPLWADSFWIRDPWQYRLPIAPAGTRWIRYYDDVLLVDTYDGRVLDVIHGFFW